MLSLSATSSRAVSFVAAPARAVTCSARLPAAAPVKSRLFARPSWSSGLSPIVRAQFLLLTARAASADAATASLYDRLGADAIKLVTSKLFDKLLVDEEIGHFFEAESLPKHKAIVARFLIGAMGGPNEYKGRNMVDAHIGLVDLRYPEDFNIVANALSSVLAELDVPKNETDDVMALVGTLEPDFKKVARFREMLDAE